MEDVRELLSMVQQYVEGKRSSTATFERLALAAPDLREQVVDWMKGQLPLMWAWTPEARERFQALLTRLSPDRGSPGEESGGLRDRQGT